MDAWSDIRLVARDCRAAALAKTNAAPTARNVIDAMVELHDLQIVAFDPGTRAGEDVLGFFERGSGIVHIARGQAEEDEVVVIAHELGHFRLHNDPESDVTDVSMRLSGEPVESGGARVDGYSSRERKEVQADVFAGEFLCPSDWLRDRLLAGARPSVIATELGLSRNLVVQQAIRALLLPPLVRHEVEEGERVVYGLDEDQQAAVDWNNGPLLVHAGPGTGKTRTLVERVSRILKEDAASSILALTFSNKAAEEMRERLSAVYADAAIELWVGTFHAFGLELVTRYAGRIGRTDKVKILDPTASLALLEAHLEQLPLHHYQNLFEPALELAFVVSAISRAKDELIGPADYLAAARADLALAVDDVAREAAGKAVEVGEVYVIYERLLAEADAVDFGDLILHAVALLSEEEVRNDVIGSYRHLLVDEYQDVNFASSMLLRAFAEDCRDIWVVADHRQSIYRFRGAEPTNVDRFPGEFGGKRHTLGINYRSGTPVVRAFAAFTGAMAGGKGSQWEANRGAVGEVTLEVCGTIEDEACAIRDRIEGLKAAGVAYRDQAILARSHLTLGRLTSVLERLGVPLLYLGDLFERGEIRDLLSLVALDAEFGGLGLVRVGQLPAYGATEHDTLEVIGWAKANDVPVIAALTRIDEIDGLSEAGRAGLAKLGAELAFVGPATTPWTMLTGWLFETGGYLDPLVRSPDPADRQKLIAIYHLLKVCGEHDAAGDRSRRRLLARIRRIELLNQDSAYRAISAEATDIDAVRVLTIHGSKGLEFPAVHLPALATRYMPASRKGARTPSLGKYPQLNMGKEDHDAEEECLFFVGLSRARDHLSLTRAQKYTTQNATASKFLDSVSAIPARTRSTPSNVPQPPVRAPVTVDPKTSYTATELETYMRCPARYRYEQVMGLRAGTDGAAFLDFHRCVRNTLMWIQQRRGEGVATSEAAALAHLDAVWADRGPVGHGFENYYRQAANRMVANGAAYIAAEQGTYLDGPLELPVAGRTLTMDLDRLVDTEGVIRLQRIRTGRQTKSEGDKPIYGALMLAGRRRFPGRAIAVEAYYPSDGTTRDFPPGKEDKAVKAFADAIVGIEAGDFPAKPEDARFCPNCPCYFICGV
ncbi:DNA helicase-2/ATP-dependent DNA helicase PcrA [Sphingomonas sp. SORGH_AS802]|uniref:UvrD-helicase domain-containing protein n=1 Tax=unclassified Sphingomonas TaxID=196159 RepID=UPI0028659BD2|nr:MULTISPECIES: UvrD-helicase domain-containing protein [unclassified Sphingomonas]MDR6126770.1 DNA helicase-2/ATP-dependent DNA helicase PcrA [Sphingomonas sp. SORGH_AS_0438]MDR6134866.1 DNA helicase-2/ATP-dependent DNA helicase PcrA [Sphingomonas sp. SORGH_AS_0802]